MEWNRPTLTPQLVDKCIKIVNHVIDNTGSRAYICGLMGVKVNSMTIPDATNFIVKYSHYVARQEEKIKSREFTFFPFRKDLISNILKTMRLPIKIYQNYSS